MFVLELPLVPAAEPTENTLDVGFVLFQTLESDATASVSFKCK